MTTAPSNQPALDETTEPRATDLQEVLQSGQSASGSKAMSYDWLAPVRERGAAHVRSMALPNRKEEAWRYTPLGFLERNNYVPGIIRVGSEPALSSIEHLLLDGVDGPRLVFVNGHFTPALSTIDALPEGVVLTALSGAASVPAVLQQHFDQVAEHRHVFAALNSALMSDGALLHVDASAQVDRPIEILHISVGDGEPAIYHPRHLLVLAAGARAEVIERYASLDGSVYFNNALIEVIVGDGAQLAHDRLQEESPAGQHLSDLHVRLGSESRYRQTLATLGGEWSRNDVKLVFAGEGAEADLNGLMLGRDGQLNDVHLDVRHDMPNCTSREAFKGILDGRGRVVFDGKIVVARDAQKTDAQLTNDNLMLSRSAEVDTKPQLEIYADDVKCSHGTTVGELDHNMLFYLRSRGIPKAQATRMLCQGFAEDVLEGFSNAAVRERASKRLDERLSHTDVVA